MAFYASDPLSTGRSRAFDMLEAPLPEFGQQAMAYRRRLEDSDAQRERGREFEFLASPGGAAQPSSEATASLFGSRLKDQRNLSRFTTDTLENIGAARDARRRAEAEAAAAAARSAAQNQANTMGLLGAGLGVVGSVAGALI